jgi:peptidoglycan/LPS O-acetylase OafA/YrhL
LFGDLVLHRGSSLSRLLSGPPAVWLAERSYGFYLWHYPILLTLLEQGAPVWLRAIAGLAGTFAVTELSWRYVEQPFLRRKRRFQRPGEVLLDVREPTSDMARLVTSR